MIYIFSKLLTGKLDDTETTQTILIPFILLAMFSLLTSDASDGSATSSALNMP